MHDELTGLPNRAAFTTATDQALRLASRDGTSTAVLLIRPEQVQEHQRHPWPQVRRQGVARGRASFAARPSRLRHVGPLGRGRVLRAPTARRGLGRRIGGCQARYRIARGAIRHRWDAMPVEASCGDRRHRIPRWTATAPISCYSGPDVAMYVAKDSHASIVTYNDELNINTPARLALLSELRAAVSGGQFVFVLPAKGSPRWQERARRRGPRALAAPHYGSSHQTTSSHWQSTLGLIKPLTSWVLNTALEQLHRWREISGNPVLGQPVRGRKRVYPQPARRRFPQRGRPTPSNAGTSLPPPGARDHREHDHGGPLAGAPPFERSPPPAVQVSIDDFGTGYSSLSYLKNLPVNELKIDRSFVFHMHRDPNDAVIVQSVIDLGRNLGLHTVAEGIEDDETWEHLHRLGCDSGQGYLLARPMPAESLIVWLMRNGSPHGLARRLDPARPTGMAFTVGADDSRTAETVVREVVERLVEVLKSVRTRCRLIPIRSAVARNSSPSARVFAVTLRRVRSWNRCCS